VSGKFDTTAFVTSAWQFMWPMWREGDDVFVQERLLLAGTLIAPFDPADPCAQIGPHRRETEPSDDPEEDRLLRLAGYQPAVAHNQDP
jgi:hypothetical protein